MSANAAVEAVATALRHPATGLAAQLAALAALGAAGLGLVPAGLPRPGAPPVLDALTTPWVARGGAPSADDVGAAGLVVVHPAGRASVTEVADEVPWWDVPVYVTWLTKADAHVADAQAEELLGCARRAALLWWADPVRRVGRCHVRTPLRGAPDPVEAHGTFGDALAAYSLPLTPAVCDPWAYALT